MIRRSRSGQSLVEVVVATGIAMLILAALVAGAMTAVRNSQFSRTKARAMQLSQEAIEWIRGERKKGWSEFTNSSGTFCLDELSFTKNRACSLSEKISNQFTRQAKLTFKDEDEDGTDDKAEVKVTTSWTDSNGEHSEEIITYLTRW